MSTQAKRSGLVRTGKAMRQWMLVCVIVTLLLVGASSAAVAGRDIGQVEPQAGAWHTWVLESGSQLRPSGPPSGRETQREIAELKKLATHRYEAAMDRIAYWNTGAPVYRWNDMALQEIMQRSMNVITGGRLWLCSTRPSLTPPSPPGTRNMFTTGRGRLCSTGRSNRLS